jgi:hypothetical protein
MAHRQRVAVVTIRVGDRSGSARSTAKETALRCVPIGKMPVPKLGNGLLQSLSATV